LQSAAAVATDEEGQGQPVAQAAAVEARAYLVMLALGALGRQGKAITEVITA
jgi:hypothetical protein